MEHSLKIMDPKHGDEVVPWDPNDPKSVTKAKKKFNAALKKGGMAYKVVTETVQKKGEQIREFDPTLGQIIITPPLAGG